MDTTANQAKQYSFIERSYRSIFVSYLTSSTTHGLKCIAEAYSTSNRILWICSFMFALGWMLFFIISSGIQYLSYPTQIDMEIRNEYTMIFPAVTICSAHPLRTDKTNAALLAYAKRMEINVTQIDLETLVEPLIVDLFNRNQRNELIDLGFQLSDILIDCSYNGINCSSFFTHSLSSQFGNCYTFNWNGTMKNLFTIRNMSTLSVGVEGLSMQFYIPRESYYPVSYIDDGLVVSIHENNEFSLVVKNGLRLQPDVGYKNWCPQCTPECKNTDFNTVLSALSYPSPKQKASVTKRLLRNQSNSSSILLPDDFALKSDLYLNNNLLKITITYSNYYVIVYNQKAKILIVDLFSSIGGQTGIWLGLSILGVIEFGEVLFKMIVKCIVLIKRQTTAKPNPTINTVERERENKSEETIRESNELRF
ncbi:unnamed protein product [Rotaria sordida]|uniref:Uncharacterized protein n=1 Tax=Rotaria sordida TaxID=392033 RepID=A0A813VAZ2_9BILA|nr:unnamed protein product [Rotaria sordida]CAF0834922.1 unnamed protein product [Rotaria sordida]CAF0870822.1 unnamed protein product [Rotaria sordida]